MSDLSNLVERARERGANLFVAHENSPVVTAYVKGWIDAESEIATLRQQLADYKLCAEVEAKARREFQDKLAEAREALRKAHDYLDSHGNGWDEAETLDVVRAALKEQE